MVHLRASWHLSLSAAPTSRNPTRLPHPETVSYGNCSASLVADRLMSRPDLSCDGEGPRGVDLGCSVRQFGSEPHDDAPHRSLLASAVREGCLDRGAAGTG